MNSEPMVTKSLLLITTRILCYQITLGVIVQYIVSDHLVIDTYGLKVLQFQLTNLSNSSDLLLHITSGDTLCHLNL